ncbi:unnamed protein product [Effrenium voratum]|nr:unnamed protein product [Effrenium voratum]
MDKVVQALEQLPALKALSLAQSRVSAESAQRILEVTSGVEQMSFGGVLNAGNGLPEA